MATARTLHVLPPARPGRPPQPRSWLRKIGSFIFSPWGLATAAVGTAGVVAARASAQRRRAEAELLDELRRQRVERDGSA